MNLRWALLALAVAAPLVHAGGLDVRVSDASGHALAGAVVMLEPAHGRLPVVPMKGIEISQSHRRFEPRVTVITVGTAVAFPNRDTVRHHVYSFSPTKPFELKLYAGVPASPVVFDKPGVAVLGCNIHDSMVAWVVVVDTPLYAVSAATGEVHLAAVPAGDYLLRVWHAGLPAGAEPTREPLQVSEHDLVREVKLPVSGEAS